jgi:hypothetical protein
VLSRRLGPQSWAFRWPLGKLKHGKWLKHKWYEMFDSEYARPGLMSSSNEVPSGGRIHSVTRFWEVKREPADEAAEGHWFSEGSRARCRKKSSGRMKGLI